MNEEITGVIMRILMMVLFTGSLIVLFCQREIESFPVTGKADERLIPLDELMITFMKKHDIPGGALAVTKGGWLIYARGFGYADVQTRRPVMPNSLFRIASLSKPITAVAVMQLIEKGILREDERMVEVLKLHNRLLPEININPDWDKITISHLLTHTAGWDRSQDGDPMFKSAEIARERHIDLPAKPWDIIAYMAPRPLQFEPGSRYSYSNFGYCLLGRIIEAKTGFSYEDYVIREIFRPLGMTESRMGKTLKKDRAALEVTYYFTGEKHPGVVPPFVGKPVLVPYGCWPLETMDAHGGWISSVVELARFVSALDDPDNCPLLRSRSIQKMFNPPHPAQTTFDSVFYAYGWLIRRVEKGRYNVWHDGSLAGSSSLMVRRYDGLNWIVLFNSGKPHQKDGAYGTVIDPLIHQAVAQIEEFPEYDLSPDYSK